MKILLAIFAAVLMLGIGNVAYAESDCQPPTTGVTLDLNMSVTKDSELCGRIGTDGATVDTVTFTLSAPYDGTLVDATSAPLAIELTASVDAAATVTLTADSSDPIISGGSTIPPSIIRAYSDDASMDLYYDGSGSQTVRTWSGSVVYADSLNHQIRKTSAVGGLDAGTYSTTTGFSYTFISDR